ncbi:uncharacterized protein LOC108908352 [Anoplophora glabripennis]|uniref:uncharacterized protein LOC108908352 n=1 Tax=Anoplophora glabripennis TaxID=217634 RepID=UPI0008748C6A|nr:uncharacterized protein LOC108908352 [Anoplophora glabripennis]
MITYSNEQLATVVALPTVTILLVWTVAIFHKNRKRWGPYDIPIISVLVLSIVRNLTVLVYLLSATLIERDSFNLDYCSIIVWIFNSIHTFQASSLTTIAVIGLFSVKLHQKQQNLRQFLTPTHIIYHLFCLTTLCACVGVAAILAQGDRDGVFESLSRAFDVSPCKFMPFDLDVKFNVFILVLHLFLAVISLFSFLIICYNFYRAKRPSFDYIKKSNSDLSDMSLGMTNTLNVNVAESNKHFYDTYTINRGQTNLENNNYYDQNQHQAQNSAHYQNGYCTTRDVNWNSDVSNLSATVSSTNSRRPCLVNNLQDKDMGDLNRTGLETIHPVLIVCYLFYHLPLIVLCIYPKLIHPWPVAGIALWLGLVQDLLIPIGLGIVDSRFCKWVTNVYKCAGKNVEEKLPQVGLDGKFRPFGSTSQPQSLEICGPDRNVRPFQAVEHRFPITNGSLYTSIDGRLPVIHNYRRNKDQRGGVKQQEKQSSNVALHSSHINRQDNPPKYPSCSNCEADLCPSHSNLHHLSPQYINKQLNLLQHNKNLIITKNVLPVRVSQSQESLTYLSEMQNRPCFYRNSDLNLNGSSNNHIMKNSRNLVRLNKMRLSRSEDSLNDLQVRELGNIPRLPTQKVALQLEPRLKQKRRSYCTKVEVNIQNGYSSSDEDYLTDPNTALPNDNFDSMSSKSCYSITTEANCDFEFFQSKERLAVDIPSIDARISLRDSYLGNSRSELSSFKQSDHLSSRNSSFTDLDKNFRITRSNSKRSLENFQAFIEIESVDSRNNNGVGDKSTLQRSNSYATLEDRKSRKQNLFNVESKLERSNFRPKIKSVEYLPNSNSSTVYIEDGTKYNYYLGDKKDVNGQNKCIGSVPDLKKVFISEYI